MTRCALTCPVPNPCKNVCSHLCLLRPGGYTCACPQGSSVVQFDANECDAAIEAPVAMPAACRCMNGGTCYTDEGRLPKCKCPYGYVGSYCEMGKSKGAPAGTDNFNQNLWESFTHALVDTWELLHSD
ncbi:Low-density lipoprotein receptor-related protein 2 [Liparis tanakae]|uniref:Low-density lipoprotein receptor-related protein 2 n=1 Tax=Liparis tanakae TaxID=230148 RepID=A0A4Z2HEY0_9TELE|nr:Low-density lipoprotein receptor-related protein 2 [Liparis tanakae]